MLRLKIASFAVAAIIGCSAFAQTTSAATVDASLTGYTFMGGATAYASTPFGPSSQKDYFLAQALNFQMGDANYWGYGWGKFDDIGTTTVDSALLYFDLLGIGSMSLTPATVENPAVLKIFSAGDIDLIGLDGSDNASWDLREELRNNLLVDSPIDEITMTANGQWCVDITGLYNDWVTGDATNNGLVFVAPDNTGGSSYAGFGSTSGSAPFIVTSTVPEPSTLLLLAFGAGLFALTKMRRKTR